MKYRNACFITLYCTWQKLCFLQTEDFGQLCIEQVYPHHFSPQHLLISYLSVMVW